jgi:hypothetical protein
MSPEREKSNLGNISPELHIGLNELFNNYKTTAKAILVFAACSFVRPNQKLMITGVPRRMADIRDRTREAVD